jgi:hypothetical protein
MECHVFNGVISLKKKGLMQLGLGTFTYNDNESDIEFMDLYNLKLGTKFNTIVVDCEGCFVDFFKENRIYILDNIITIIMENDRFNHNEVLNILVNFN